MTKPTPHPALNRRGFLRNAAATGAAVAVPAC